MDTVEVWLLPVDGHRDRVHRIVGELIGVAPDRIRWRYGPHGKPDLDHEGAPKVNLSHSGQWALFAVSAGRSVGVDLQGPFTGSTPNRLAARYFSAAEADYVAAGADPADRFGRLWVAKEACVKADGGRLMDGLARSVLAGAAEHAIRMVAAPEGFHAAVALAGRGPFRVVLRGKGFSPGA